MLNIKKRYRGDRPAMDSLGHKQVTISIPPGSDLERQLQLIHLSERDLQLLQTLQPGVTARIDEIVDRFYRNIMSEQSLAAIINRHSTVDRLKTTLRRHLIEMFDGKIDEAYIKQRHVIAHIHMRIGLQPKWYMCAFQELLASLLNIADTQYRGTDAYMPAILAVTKILSLEQQIVLESYESELEKVRQASAEEKAAVKTQVEKNAADLASVAEQTTASLEELSAQSQEIVASARNVSEAAGEIERYTHTGQELLETQLSRLSRITDIIRSVSEEVVHLKETSERIQEVVQIVRDIADQTNLLALNAAIEAARAGEQGRGFGIVASEVRKLAEQTRNQVADVTDLIERTSQQIAVISDAMPTVVEHAESTSESARETDDLYRIVTDQAASINQRNHQILSDLELFAQVIAEMSEGSTQVADAAEALMELTRTL